MGVVGNLMFAIGFKVADSALAKTESQLSGLQKSVFAIGAAGVAALGSFGIASISAASDFEASMSSIQTATGMTNEQLAATKGIAKDLYSDNFGESWADLGDAISTTTQITGQQGEALKETTKRALLLRDSMGFEIPESVKTANTLMKQFGITSDQAFNLIAQGKQKGLDFSGEMLDSVNEYANQFKALGFDANQMFDTLAVGAQNGAFNLDKVGDAVKEFNIRAKDGSKTTVQAFEMLGLDANKMMETFARGGPQAQKSFTQIVQMIGDIQDPVQQNAVAVNLFGTQFEDLEKNVITAMGTVKSQFDMSKGTMDQLNQMKFTSPGQAMEMFKRSLVTGILIPVGEKLLPYLNQFGQWLATHKDQIAAFGAALGDKIGAAVDWVAGSIAGLIPTLSDLWDRAQSIWDVLSSWSGLVPIVAGLAAAIGTYKTVVTVAAKAQQIWNVAQIAWKAITMANPFTLIITGLVALGVALVTAYKKSETFRNIVNGAWAAVKTGVSAVLNFFTVTIPFVFNRVLEFIRQWGPLVLAVITGPIGLAVYFVVKHWDEIKAKTVAIFTSVKTFISNVWDNITSSIANAGTNIWNKIVSVWERVTGFLKGINLFDIGKNIIEGLVNGIGSMVTSVVDKMKEIGNSITDKVKSILGIHSPSRVMMELGFFTGEGLAQGIEGTQSRVGQASGELAQEVTGESSNVLPAAASLPPARVNQGSANFAGRMQVDFNVNLQGSNLDAQQTSTLMTQIRQAVQDVFAETMRRSGIEAVVE